MSARRAVRGLLAAVVVALPASLSPLLLPATAPAAHAAAAPRITEVTTSARSNVVRDGQRVSRFAFEVQLANGTGLAASNLAFARANCRNCRSTAVSVQIAVVGHVPGLAEPRTPGRPAVVRVRNVALAEDVGLGVRSGGSGSGQRAATCSRCSTLALAYQFVVVGRHRLRITPAARTRLTRIETQMRAAVTSGASPTVVQARVDALARQIEDVLETGVVLWPHP